MSLNSKLILRTGAVDDRGDVLLAGSVGYVSNKNTRFQSCTVICLRTEGLKLICKQLLIARTDRGLYICLKLERITSSKEEDLNEKKKVG